MCETLPGSVTFAGGLRWKFMRLNRGLVPMLLLAACAPASASADTRLATVSRPTELAAGFGVLLYSAYDAQAGNFRLMALKDGRTTALPVAPSARSFQADVGPTASGHAFYVYSRCGAEPGSCDLYAFNPATGAEQRSKASDPKHDDLHPTYWKGTLAFVREYGSAKEPHQVVYQRPTADTARSERLPGIPRQRCAQGSCIDPAGRFDGLELYGRRLAQTTVSLAPVVLRSPGRPDEVSASAQVALRLVDVETRRSLQLARSGRGEGGQTFTGVAFAAGRLYTSYTCLGDPGGCTNLRAGLYRYAYGAKRWAFSPEEPATYALAVDGTSLAVLRDGGGLECDQEGFGPSDAPRCALVRRDPAPTFAAIPAP